MPLRRSWRSRSLDRWRSGPTSGWRAICVPVRKEAYARLRVVALVGQLPAQCVSESIVGVEEEGDVERVANRPARRPSVEHRPHIVWTKLLGMQREDLEEPEHGTQLLVDRSRPVVVQDRRHDAFAQRRLRDRGVSAGSEDALVEARHERGEHLPLAHRPGRRPTHDPLRQAAPRVAEELLAVLERADDTGGVACDQSNDAEHHPVEKTVSRVNSVKSHARSRAASPARSRFLEAPSAALTTISNIWSSPYFAWRTAMSSSVTW